MIQSDSRSLHLKSVPVILGEPIWDPLSLKEILRSQPGQIPDCIDSILMSKACKGAIKFNEFVDQKSAVLLLESLKACEYPFNCVHGRSSVFVAVIMKRSGRHSIE